MDDGSIAELRDKAEISTAFTAGERRVIMENGTAHFQVAHDTARPFVVVAPGV